MSTICIIYTQEKYGQNSKQRATLTLRDEFRGYYEDFDLCSLNQRVTVMIKINLHHENLYVFLYMFCVQLETN